MKFLLKNGRIHGRDGVLSADLLIENGIIAAIEKNILVADAISFEGVGLDVFPGFTDVHVHLREPGFFFKERIATGTAAAAHGGYTTVFAMPNLNPVPDTPENLRLETDIIDRDAVIAVYPYGAITMGQQGQMLSDMEGLAPHVIAFSDDGHGVQSDRMMEEAMKKAKSLGKTIVAHCEDNSLLHGGCIHDGAYAKAHNLPGICSESEWGQIVRDIALVRRTGCAYHVCHISTKESVAAIRAAKKEGVNITCETAPHYLTLTDADLRDEGRFKMNPPLRAEEDRQALLAGLSDGTIDMIATDHAPHTEQEKSRGLRGSPFGIVGLETAFPILYTRLVKTGLVSLSTVIDKLTASPAKRFGLPPATIAVGAPANLCVFDLNASYQINPQDFLSQGKATPYEGNTVFGKCKLTIAGGKIVWQENN